MGMKRGKSWHKRKKDKIIKLLQDILNKYGVDDILHKEALRLLVEAYTQGGNNARLE